MQDQRPLQRQDTTEATTKANRTGSWCQPWGAGNQPTLQSYKPMCPIGKTQKQGELSFQPWEEYQEFPQPRWEHTVHCLDHRTVPESPWAPACWMSRMMVPVPPGPTCSGPLRGGHREPQGSPTLTASQRTHWFWYSADGELWPNFVPREAQKWAIPEPFFFLSHPHTAFLKALLWLFLFHFFSLLATCLSDWS